MYIELIRDEFNTVDIVKQIDTGVERSYIINTEKGKFFLKFLNSGYFKPEGFIAGGKLLEIIREKTLIPAADLYTTSFDIENYSDTAFYITEYISGDHLDGYMENLSERFYKNMFSELGLYTAEYNNIPIKCDLFGWAGWFNNSIKTFGGHKKFKNFLLQRITDSLSKIKQENPMFYIREPVRDTLEYIQNLELNFSGPCLVNYDIKFQNIIFNTNQDSNTAVKCIVDWDNPIIGTVSYNLAKAERHFKTGYSKKNYTDKVHFDIFFEEYQKNSKYDIDKEILTSLEMDLCRLEDFVDVSKHFLNYYDHLDKEEQQVAKEYYETQILNILEKIR